MRKLSIVFFFLPVLAIAQTQLGPIKTPQVLFGPYTVGSLPPASQWVGYETTINNGTNGSDCTIGGGTFPVKCFATMAGWVAFAGSSSSASPGGPNNSVQTNLGGTAFGGYVGFTYNSLTGIAKISGVEGGSSSANEVDAIFNNCGVAIVGDSVIGGSVGTDNCTALTALLQTSCVPLHGKLHIPSPAYGNYYHVDPTNASCLPPAGVVINRPDILIYGDGWSWDGATYTSTTGHLHGSVFDATFSVSVHPNVNFDNLAVDLGGPASSNPFSTGFSSGTFQPGMMNSRYTNLAIQGSMVVGHGVLTESGGGNYVNNVTTFNMFDGVADRSGNGRFDNLVCYNPGIDCFVEKADPGSGPVCCDMVGKITAIGSSTSTGGGLVVVSDDSTAEVSNSTYDSVLCQNLATCVNVQSLSASDGGGLVDTITIGKINAFNVGTGYFTQITGPNFGQIQRVDVSQLEVTIANVGAQNSDGVHLCTTCSIAQMHLNAIATNPTTYGFFNANTSGWNVFSGNATDPNLTSNNAFAGDPIAAVAGNTYTGVTTCSVGGGPGTGSSPCFQLDAFEWGPLNNYGLPGVAMFASNISASRASQNPMTQVIQLGAWGTDGTRGIFNFGSTGTGSVPSQVRYVLDASLGGGTIYQPSSDSFPGNLFMSLQNHAGSNNIFSVSYAGSISGVDLIQNCAIPAISGFISMCHSGVIAFHHVTGVAGDGHDDIIGINSSSLPYFVPFGGATAVFATSQQATVPDPVNPTDAVNLESLGTGGYIKQAGTITPNSFATLDGANNAYTPCGSNCQVDGAGDAMFAGSVSSGIGSSSHYDQFPVFNTLDPACGPSSKACIFPFVGSPNNMLWATVDGGASYPFLSQSGIVLTPLAADPGTLFPGLAYFNTTANFASVAKSTTQIQRLVHSGLIGHYRPTGNNYIGAYIGQADAGTSNHSLGIVIGDSTVSGFSTVNTSWVETVIDVSTKPMLTELLQNRLVSPTNPSGFGGVGWGSIAAANNLEPTGLAINTASATHLVVSSHNGTTTFCPDDQVGEDDTVGDIVTWTASKTTLLTFYALKQVNGGTFDVAIDGGSYTGSPTSSAGASYGSGLASMNSGALTEGSHSISVKVIALGTGSKGIAYCGVRTQDTTNANTFEMQKWGRAASELWTWNNVPSAVLTALAIDPAFVAIESGINERQNNDRTLAQIQNDFHTAKTTINTVWPGAAVIYVSPHNTNNSLCGGGTCTYTTLQVANAIRDQANADDVPFLNFYDYTSNNSGQVENWVPCPYTGGTAPTCFGVHFNDLGNTWLAQIACNRLTDFNCSSGAAAPNYGWNQVIQTTNYTLLPTDFSGPTNPGKWFQAQGLGDSPTYTLPATAPPVFPGSLDPCARFSNIGTGTVTINSSGIGVDGITTGASAMTIANGQYTEICSSGSTYKSFGTTSRNAGSAFITAVTTPINVASGLASLQDARGTAVTNVPNLFLEGDATIVFNNGATTDVAQTIETPSANTMYHCDLVMSQTVADNTCTTHGVLAVQYAWTDALSGQVVTSANNIGWRSSTLATWTTSAVPSETATSPLGASTVYYALNNPVVYEASGSAFGITLHVATQASTCTTYPTFKVHYKCTK